MKKLRLFDATTLLTSELLEGASGLSADQISEFICDGVIILTVEQVGVVEDRSLLIRKMRYTGHERKFVTYNISSQGIEIKDTRESFKV